MARDRIKRGVLGMILNCFLFLGKRLRPYSSRVDWCGEVNLTPAYPPGQPDHWVRVSIIFNDDGSVTLSFPDPPPDTLILSPVDLVDCALCHPHCFRHGDLGEDWTEPPSSYHPVDGCR